MFQVEARLVVGAAGEIEAVVLWADIDSDDTWLLAGGRDKAKATVGWLPPQTTVAWRNAGEKFAAALLLCLVDAAIRTPAHGVGSGGLADLPAVRAIRALCSGKSTLLDGEKHVPIRGKAGEGWGGKTRCKEIHDSGISVAAQDGYVPLVGRLNSDTWGTGLRD